MSGLFLHLDVFSQMCNSKYLAKYQDLAKLTMHLNAISL